MIYFQKVTSIYKKLHDNSAISSVIILIVYSFWCWISDFSAYKVNSNQSASGQIICEWIFLYYAKIEIIHSIY